jgi:hypothetical protein
MTLKIDEFGPLFELCSRRTLESLSRPLRRPAQVRARIEFAMLAVVRYGLPSTEAARLIRKHPTSITRWVELGIADLKSSPSFRRRIDDLDQQISRSARNNA